MNSKLVTESIPYTSEKERFKLTKELLKDNKEIEVWENEKAIYSVVKTRKGRGKRK